MTTATITLGEILTHQAKLTEMIAAFQAGTKTLFTVPETQINLGPGERYAGLILSSNGEPSHHLILLPGQAEDMNWQDAIDWASKAGGELPTRQEQSLLFANLKGEFERAWYWSSEQSSDAYAWGQYFYYGDQSNDYKSAEGRARAVRLIQLNP